MTAASRKQRDRQWAERIRSGDRDAFKNLFHAHADELCAFAAQYVADEQAEDMVQTVFCDLWNRRAEWEPQSVKAYLFQAVRNTSLDHLKHRRVKETWEAEEKERKHTSSHATSQASPVDTVQHQELEREMRQAVEGLPDRRRIIYQMAHHHGMSYKEIAAALDIAPKTVENQVGRALKALRDHLAKFASFLQ